MTSPKNPSTDDWQTVRGTRDILGADYYAYQGFSEKAAEIAIYYGFSPIETPVLEAAALFERAVGEHTDIIEKEIYHFRTKGGDHLALRPEGTAPIMRAYFANGLQSAPQPVLLYYGGPYFRHDKPQRGRYRELRQFGLEVIGTPKSIADAIIIRLVRLVLGEAGLKNLRLELNTIGDKNCQPVYRRELANYYKRHLRQLCDNCRERLKTNPLRLLDCKEPGCQPIKGNAPKMMSYLCAPCKIHFKEVLEYLETMGIAYEINEDLVRGLDYYSRTVFEISEVLTTPAADALTETPSPLALAGGGRYDYLARALSHKKDVPAVGAAIGVDRVMLSPNYVRQTPRLVKKPKVFFIQLSFDAKLKSLTIIEILRRAKIPLAQSLSKDSLGAQLAIAEKMQVPYVLIFGQKEAVDDTVIVRQMQNRSQETVKLNNLAEYLKNLK